MKDFEAKGTIKGMDSSGLSTFVNSPFLSYFMVLENAVASVSMFAISQ